MGTVQGDPWATQLLVVYSPLYVGLITNYYTHVMIYQKSLETKELYVWLDNFNFTCRIFNAKFISVASTAVCITQ